MNRNAIFIGFLYTYFQFVKWKSRTVIFYKTFDKNGAFSILQP